MNNLRTRTYLLGTACAFLLALAGPASAQETQLVTELHKLNQSLQGLQQLMKEQLAANQLNTAIAYLNFRSRKIEVLERDREGMRKDRERMQGFLDDLTQRKVRLEEEKRNTPNLSPQEFNLAKEELEQREIIVKKRMEQLESDALTVDIKIGELRSQIDNVERYVESHFRM